MVQTADLARTLENIGLTENEARVYLALLELESSTAYRVAERCEVKKPTVYLTLEDLRKKGLVLKVPHAKKSLFAARDIREYLQDQKQKLRAVETIAPTLQSLGGKTKPSVFFFTGLRGSNEALGHKFEQMRGKTFRSFYGSLIGGNRDIMDLYTAWDQKALANDISFEIIMAEEAKGAYYKDIIELGKREPDRVRIKFLKQYVYPPNISVEIAEDFVRIDDEKNLQVTIIDDKNTADAFRQIFQIVWEKGV